MSEQPVTPPAPAPRESLCGDRLCMHCMHPLAGRAIEREPTTGLLFVRCGECGSASALFEYPSVAPWVRRFKSVAASTFAILALAVTLAMAGVAGVFTGASAGIAADESVKSVLDELPGTAAKMQENDYQAGSYSVADIEWLRSAEAAPILRRSRLSLRSAAPFLSIGAVGTVLITPLSLLLGVALMRRSLVERAAIAGLVALSGATIAYLILLAEDAARSSGGFTPSWTAAVYSINAPYFALASGSWYTALAACTAVIAPSAVAAFFRFVLPPADRRLVAWLWEWRGKPVPRD